MSKKEFRKIKRIFRYILSVCFNFLFAFVGSAIIAGFIGAVHFTIFVDEALSEAYQDFFGVQIGEFNIHTYRWGILLGTLITFVTLTVNVKRVHITFGEDK